MQDWGSRQQTSTGCKSAADTACGTAAGPGSGLAEEQQTQMQQQCASSWQQHHAALHGQLLLQLQRLGIAGPLLQQQQQQQQLLLQLDQQLDEQQPREPRPPAVPLLNLAALSAGGSSKAAPPHVCLQPHEEDAAAAGSEQVAARDAELCFEAGSACQLHPAALLQDNRCYVYRPVGRADVATLESLLLRLPDAEKAEVLGLWDQLMVARRNCEMLAARGMRISRDISRDWQETVSDLIDRVVAQDKELAQLRGQLQAAHAGMDRQPSGGLEELNGQVVRLNRQRDRLLHEQQELGRELAAARTAAQAAYQQTVAAKDQLSASTLKSAALKESYASLLQQHIDLARYAASLEPAMDASQHAVPLAACDARQLAAGSSSPSGTHPHALRGAAAAAARAASSGRQSPLCSSLPASRCSSALASHAKAAPPLRAGHAVGSSSSSFCQPGDVSSSKKGAGPARGASSFTLGTLGSKGLAAALGHLQLRGGGDPSGTSSPGRGSGQAIAAAVRSSLAVKVAAPEPGRGMSPASDDADTLSDRPSGRAALSADWREADQYDQEPSPVLQLPKTLGGGGGLEAAAGARGGSGSSWRPDLHSVIAAAEQQLHVLLAM